MKHNMYTSTRARAHSLSLSLSLSHTHTHTHTHTHARARARARERERENVYIYIQHWHMATTRTATAPRQSETPVIMRTTPAGIWDALLSDVCEGLFISYALMLTATCTHSVTYGSTCNIDLYRHSNNTENRIFMMMMMIITIINIYIK